MTNQPLTAARRGIKNPETSDRALRRARPLEVAMAKPPNHDSPVSGVSRRTFLKTAGVGAPPTSLIGAGPGAAGPTPLGPDAAPLPPKINGAARTATVEPRVTPLRALPNHPAVTGAKE